MHVSDRVPLFFSTYERMRKTNPSNYHLSQTQKQMLHDQQQLGESFYDAFHNRRA